MREATLPTVLVAEIAALRERLAEAEELRRAIGEGEVDAFVVGRTEEAKRVLMLSGAYARYRQLVEDMQQGAVTVSRAGEVLFANHSFAALLGLSPASLHRTALDQYVAPGQRAALAALLAPAGPASELAAVLHGAGGLQRRVRLSVVSSNEDFITLLVTQTIEEDHSLEEARDTVEALRSGQIDAVVVGESDVVLLDAAQRFYQAAVEGMQQGVAIVDGDGRIGYANQRLTALLGRRGESITGALLHTLVDRADHAVLAAVLSARRGANGQVELRLRKADHEPLSALLSVSPLPDGQKMCLISDLTLQKRHAAADECTRKFLGMLAHELRNMLAPIRASVAALNGAPALDAESRELVARIDRNSARLAALIEDLRTINPRE
ncbi:MAG TPA: PAS domain-containing protein [Burkholderiales bacterium]|nr:PAS domain-containing protein [Burkholderiales bacterium]